MFYTRDFAEPKRLADRLPWAILMERATVYGKPGTFQTTFEFRGPDLYSASRSEIDAICARVNNTLKRPGARWAYFFEARRQKSRAYPQSTWPTQAGALIDGERRKSFQTESAHFATRYYFTLTYLTPEERVNRLADRFFMRDSGPAVDYTRQLAYFHGEVDRIFDILQAVFPMTRRLSDAELLTYLQSTISTTDRHGGLLNAPPPPEIIDWLLPDQLLRGGLDMQLGEEHLKVLTLTGFPMASHAGMLDALTRLDFEYRWMTRFICLPREKALSEIKKRSRKWFAKRKSVLVLFKEAFFNQPESDILDNSDAVTKARECGQFAEMVSAGTVSAGYYTSTFVLWDKDREQLNQKCRAIRQIIGSAGFACIDETYNALQAWFGSLPGHCWANVRRPIVSSMNLTHLIPLAADWDGPAKDHHLDAPPLFYAKTAGAPFRFCLHSGDVGHTFICGPTGSGKSVLLSFMAASFLRYKDARVVMFDKGFSALGITAAMNGTHYDLGADDQIVFQPLKDIDRESERAWALEWLQDIVVKEGLAITPELKNELWRTLASLSGYGPQDRTLTGLSALVQSVALRDALNGYTVEGSGGHLLDASADSLQNARWQCFEMDYLMHYQPRAVVPVLTYLFHQIDRRFSGPPGLIILDEVWLFLDHPVFAARIREWLKTLRKRNVSVVFATQTLADITESTIVSTLADACPNRIYLPNARAREEALRTQYQRFGLSTRQIDIIARAIPKKEYYLQAADGNRKFDLDLGPIALALCGSSSREDIRLIKELMNQTTGQDTFVKAFLKRKKDVHLIGAYHAALAN